MLRFDQVAPQIIQIGDSCMSSYESLSLPDRFESPHPSLSHPGRLMRLLGPIISILICHMECFGYDLSMSHTIASQFIRHDLPRRTTMAFQ